MASRQDTLGKPIHQIPLQFEEMMKGCAQGETASESEAKIRQWNDGSKTVMLPMYSRRWYKGVPEVPETWDAQLASSWCKVDRIIPMPTPNALFAVFAVSDPDAVEKRLQAIAPWLYLNVGTTSWLVVAPSATTTKELCDRIGLGSVDPMGAGIVVRAEGYFGRAPGSIWEWIATKQGAELGTATPV